MKTEDMWNNNETEENTNQKPPIIVGISVAAVLVIAIIAIVLITSSAKTEDPASVIETKNTAAKVETQEKKTEDVETKEISSLENTEEVTKETPDQWFESLGLVDPAVAIWNDITGTKFVVEEKGQYEVQEGTKISYFIPEGFKFKGMYPYEIFADFKYDHGYIINPAIDKISGSKECYVEWDENGETKSLTFTLTTENE